MPRRREDVDEAGPDPAASPSDAVADERPLTSDEIMSMLPDLSPQTPEEAEAERRALRREIWKRQHYVNVLLARDRSGRRDWSAMAGLLREPDLPLWVRLQIADAIDPKRRSRYERVAEVDHLDALGADDPERLLLDRGYSQRLASRVACEARVIGMACEHRALVRSGMRPNKAVDLMTERHGIDRRRVQRLIAQGQASDFFDPEG